jgi:hypothetical protein
MHSQWKTVREVQLEGQIAKLERALYKAHYEAQRDSFVVHEHRTSFAAPPAIQLPRVMSITAMDDVPGMLGVAARVWTDQPFGLNYYVNPGLLTDTGITAQVLGLEHERFVRQLADFVERHNTKEKKHAGK